MSLFDEPKIDCHAHIFDPVNFPYGKSVKYYPAGQEVGTLAQLRLVMETYGVHHALLVQPNSGYGPDNSYILDAIKHGEGRFKGIASIPNDVSLDDLIKLKNQGIVGAAINPTFEGLGYYRNARVLIEKLAELDMFANIQVQDDDLLMFMPWLEEIPVKILIDHCGRPTPGDSLDRPGFRGLLNLAGTGRASIKISGFAKFSKQPYPFEDIRRQLQVMIGAFTPHNCMWASDWPFLRAPQRQDYGHLMELTEQLFPSSSHRSAVLWDTPRRLFGFGT